MSKKWVKTWLVDFGYITRQEIGGETREILEQIIETVEVKRVNAPTRWARNHALTLRRHLQGTEVGFSITGL